jgi:DNA repair protein RadC
MENMGKNNALTWLEERFVRHGLNELTNKQIIELIVCRNVSKQECRIMTTEIMERYKTLREFIKAPVEELRTIPGMNERCIISIKMMQDIPSRFLKEEIIEKPFCVSSQEIFDYLYYSMRDLKKEVFRIVYLNNQSQIIDTEELFEGTLSEIHIYPREVQERAIKHNAHHLIFVHNHPSGDPTPSHNDEKITRDLVFIGKVLLIGVLDHIIIGNNRYFSFASSGLIEKYENEFLNLRLKLDIKRGSSPKNEYL